MQGILAEESPGDLFQPLISGFLRPRQDVLDVRPQPGLSPAVPGCFLGSERLTDPGALQQRTGRRAIVVGVIPRRQGVAARGAVLARVLPHERS